MQEQAPPQLSDVEEETKPSNPYEDDEQGYMPIPTWTVFYDGYVVDTHHNPGHDKGGGPSGGGGPKPTGPAIDLFSVVLHELGHSLGLPHSDPNDGIDAVMDPFYRGPVSSLSAQDITNIQALFPENGVLPNTGWQDLNGDGIIEITYSFMPDKTHMESGVSSLFKTLNSQFGSEETWQEIFRDAMDQWEAATQEDNGSDGDLINNVEIQFVEVIDDGFAFNYAGEEQNDPHAGDIRIGMHQFDGSSGVLAHAYYPPPNGSTAAGDIHLDKAENWQDLQAEALDVDIWG